MKKNKLNKEREPEPTKNRKAIHLYFILETHFFLLVVCETGIVLVLKYRYD
jgi:hypothetical protein